jgi:hypothetical protein
MKKQPTNTQIYWALVAIFATLVGLYELEIYLYDLPRDIRYYVTMAACAFGILVMLTPDKESNNPQSASGKKQPAKDERAVKRKQPVEHKAWQSALSSPHIRRPPGA